MEANEILKILENKNWKEVNKNSKYTYYKPPQDLGFPDNYLMPIPIWKGDENNHPEFKFIIQSLEQIYDTSISELLYGVENYFELLKKDALYFKLNSIESRFDKTLEIKDIYEFLKGISNSFRSYVKVRYNKVFQEVMERNPLGFSYDLNQLISYSQLRLVDLQFKSFSFGVSTDILMGNENYKNKDVPEFRKELLPSYRKEIIDIDLTSKKEVENLLNEFSVDERREVLKPLLDNLNKQKIDVNLTNKNFETIKTFKKVPKSTIEDLLPRPEQLPIEKKELEIVQLIVQIDPNQDAQNIRIKKQDLESFSQHLDNFELTFNEVNLGDKVIKFSEPVIAEIEYYKDDQVFDIHLNDKFSLKSSEFKKIPEDVNNELSLLYTKFQNLLLLNSDALNEDDKVLISFFNELGISS